MKIAIDSVQDLGLALRAVRRSSDMRLDDMASLVGVSKQFVSDVELGKDTVRMGLVLKVLAEMGLRLSVDIPAQSEAELMQLKAKAGAAVEAKALKRRKPRAAAKQA